MRYHCTTYSKQYKGYVMNSAYHNGCSWRKTGWACRRCPGRWRIHSAPFAISSAELLLAPYFMTLLDNGSPLTSDHFEPPSTACPYYPGTAFSNRPSCEEPAIYRYTYDVESRSVDPSTNAAASPSPNTNLPTKQRAPQSQKRTGAETTLNRQDRTFYFLLILSRWPFGRNG